ncbi:MAG: tetratricopeptide repeat protein [Myxococcota bacterium]
MTFLTLVLSSLLTAPADQAQARLDAAQVAFAQGDLDLARAEVDAALSVDADNPDALLAAARLARKAGDPDTAARHLARLLELDPDDDDARFELALAQAEVGQRDAAGSTLDALVARDPQRAEALAARARLSSGDDVRGTDTGGVKPLARLGLGMTYDSNVQLASSQVPSTVDRSTPTIDVEAVGGITYGRADQLQGARPFTLLARVTNQTSTDGDEALHGVVPSTIGLIAQGQHRFGAFQLALDMRYTEIFVDSFSQHVQRLIAPSVWASRAMGRHVFRFLGGIEYRDTEDDVTIAGPDNVTYELALRDTMRLAPVRLILDLRGAINKASDNTVQALVDFKEVAGFAYAWVPVVGSLSAFGLGEVAGRAFEAGDVKEVTYRTELGARYGFDVFELHAEYGFMRNVSDRDARTFNRHVVSAGVRFWYQ